jgi:hypothetical protein
MVMPGDERQMPGEGWRDVRANYGSGSRDRKYGGQQRRVGLWLCAGCAGSIKRFKQFK